MTLFPFDELKIVFIEEVKNAFTQFIKKNHGGNPYIFSVVPREYCPDKCPSSFGIEACGNTITNFKKCSVDDLYSYYCCEEWVHSSTEKDFSKTDKVILDYCTKNKDSIMKGDGRVTDEKYQGDSRYTQEYLEIIAGSEYTKEFMKFKADLFDFLVKNLVHLRNTGFFNSIYNEKIIINFEFPNFEDDCDSYYTDDVALKIFEKLNTEEEIEKYKKYIQNMRNEDDEEDEIDDNE